MTRRAQAALEYLFTYGWAFLAILLTIGSLMYFGVFDISNLRSSSCEFPPGIICEEFVLGDHLVDDALVVDLRNTFGADLEVTNVNATSRITGDSTCGEWDGSSIQPVDDSNPLLWNHEDTVLFACEITQNYVEGQAYDFVFLINFTQQGHTYEHYTKGTVFATAQ